MKWVVRNWATISIRFVSTLSVCVFSNLDTSFEKCNGQKFSKRKGEKNSFVHLTGVIRFAFLLSSDKSERINYDNWTMTKLIQWVFFLLMVYNAWMNVHCVGFSSFYFFFLLIWWNLLMFSVLSVSFTTFFVFLSLCHRCERNEGIFCWHNPETLGYESSIHASNCLTATTTGDNVHHFPVPRKRYERIRYLAPSAKFETASQRLPRTVTISHFRIPVYM